jgi:hypothetical protein
MKCDEIFAVLAMLEKERGISQTFMMDKIVQALTTAYKRDHEGVENVVVDVDEGKRELKMFVQKEVVDEVENPGTQMSLDDAKAISAKYNVGDIVNIPVDNIEFGRIAAGNGKQVIIQGLREAESGMVYDEYNSKQHEILTGVVTRIDPRTGNASLRIGTGTEATDAILLAGEQVKGETLVEGQRIKVYLVDVRRQSRGPQVVISRTHPGLVKRLFELEVPEIYDGTVEMIDNPSSYPDPSTIVKQEEPFVDVHLYTPNEYVGSLMDLCQQKRGVLADMKYLDDVRVDLHYALPLGEIVYDFFDAIKSRSRGYASYDYEFKEYRESDLVKLDFLLNGDPVDALSMIVFRDNAYGKGRRICEKLRDNIPRTLFEIPVQAAIGGKIIARETVKAMRKDVLAKCYGGDITRKKKLLEKQKEGKKKMRQLGSVSLPSEAFTAVLKLDSDDD